MPTARPHETPPLLTRCQFDDSAETARQGTRGLFSVALARLAGLELAPEAQASEARP